MAGFTGANAILKPPLATGVEWTTAALETPDLAAGDNTYCNISGGTFSASSNFGKCVSRFGTFDQIGNAFELTDEVSFDKTNWERFYGTSQVTNPFGKVVLPSSNGWVLNWNYITAFVSSTGGLTNSDYTRLPTSNLTSTPAYGGYSNGAGWMPIRGGNWSEGSHAGRFSFISDLAPNFINVDIGVRCSIAAP